MKKDCKWSAIFVTAFGVISIIAALLFVTPFGVGVSTKDGILFILSFIPVFCAGYTIGRMAETITNSIMVIVENRKR